MLVPDLKEPRQETTMKNFFSIAFFIIVFGTMAGASGGAAFYAIGEVLEDPIVEDLGYKYHYAVEYICEEDLENKQHKLVSKMLDHIEKKNKLHKLVLKRLDHIEKKWVGWEIAGSPTFQYIEAHRNGKKLLSLDCQYMFQVIRMKGETHERIRRASLKKLQ
jgi:hypothetical protein